MYILSKYLTVQYRLGANDKENKLIHAEYRVNSFQSIFDLWLVKAMDMSKSVLWSLVAWAKSQVLFTHLHSQSEAGSCEDCGRGYGYHLPRGRA